MKTCPSGHRTSATDFCEVCGMEIEPNSTHVSIQTQPTLPPVPTQLPPVPAAPGFAHPRSPLDKICPICTTPRAGIFCDLCDYNFATCQAPVESESIFPPLSVPTEPLEPEPLGDTVQLVAWEISLEPQTPGNLLTSRTVPFRCSEMVIGRSSKRNPQKPDIDLYGDDSVSHRHAILRVVDGGVTLADLGSANGTLLNKKPVQPHQAIAIQPGDRITVGFKWFLLLKTRS